MKNEIISWIKKTVKEAGAEGIVVGLSGGIDSAVVAHLATEALGKDNVLGVWIAADSSREASRNSLRVAHELDIRQIRLNISEEVNHLVDKTLTEYETDTPEHFERYISGEGVKKDIKFRETDKFDLILGNLKARMRTSMLYVVAQNNNYLVAGTGNKSEEYIGYFTKWGDGASDFNPILHLTKTEVYELAKSLNINERIIKQAPSADLWDGQTDEDELGFTYETLDKYLSGEEIDSETKEKIENLHKKNLHKLNEVPNMKEKED